MAFVAIEGDSAVQRRSVGTAGPALVCRTQYSNCGRALENCFRYHSMMAGGGEADARSPLLSPTDPAAVDVSASATVNQNRPRRAWRSFRLFFVTLAIRMRGKSARQTTDASLNAELQEIEDTSAISIPRLLFLMVGLVILGAVNGVLYKWVLILFGQRYAFAVDQGNNVNYIIFSFLALVFRMVQSSRMAVADGVEAPKTHEPITLAMIRRVPQWKFILMGTLDGLGTFLSAIGGVFTPGMMQTLLNQLLIPFTMVISFFLLRVRYSYGEVAGALVILAGAGLTVGPSITVTSSTFRWYSVLIYTGSNIPMSFSAIWKQWAFQETRLDVFWLTFCVGFYQFLISFAFMPLLSIPGFGSIQLDRVPASLYQGFLCWAGVNSFEDDACTPLNGVALTLYTAVNFSYNLFGLFLTKEGSAVLSSMGYAVKLPATNIAFAMCFFLGPKLCEPFTLWTGLGLAVVLLGFSVYSFAMRKSRKEVVVGTTEVEKVMTPAHSDTEDSDEVNQPSFQDRVVGMGMAIA